MSAPRVGWSGWFVEDILSADERAPDGNGVPAKYGDKPSRNATHALKVS